MSDLRIHVDGSERQVAAGTTAADVLEGDRSVIAARVGRRAARPRATSWPRATRSSRSRSTLPTAGRSCATRPRTSWPRPCRSSIPDAKLGIGPPIENGFYYDFDVADAVHPRRPRAHRQADAADRQGGAVVRPPGRHRRRGAGRARRRAVQARADRAQGTSAADAGGRRRRPRSAAAS